MQVKDKSSSGQFGMSEEEDESIAIEVIAGREARSKRIGDQVEYLKGMCSLLGLLCFAPVETFAMR